MFAIAIAWLNKSDLKAIAADVAESWSYLIGVTRAANGVTEDDNRVDVVPLKLDCLPFMID